MFRGLNENDGVRILDCLLVPKGLWSDGYTYSFFFEFPLSTSLIFYFSLGFLIIRRVSVL